MKTAHFAAPRRALVATVALFAMAIALTGCGGTDRVLGVQANTAVPQDEPPLTPDQAIQIAGRVLSQVQRADAVRTDEAAGVAFTGLARTLTKPAYAVANARSKPNTGTDLKPSVEPARVMITTGRAYPRYLFAVWTPPSASLPELVTMSTPKATQPYRVENRVSLVPGATLPATASNVVGSEIVAADQSGLSATPKQAIKDLALLLETGKSGKTKFATSAVVNEIRQRAAAEVKAVKATSALSQRHTASTAEPLVLRTPDGGVLALSVVNRKDQYRVRSGAGVLVPNSDSNEGVLALNPKAKKVSKAMDISRVQMVALVIPPSQAKSTSVKLIGFSETYTSVKVS
ncbi:MAG: hypothetical protein ACRCTR_01585 [Actinomycetota bacterium]